MQRIEELRQEVRSSPPHTAPSDTLTNDHLREIEDEIIRLRADLPILLQATIDLEDDIFPREGRISPIVLGSLLDSIRDTSRIRILVRTLNQLDEAAIAHFMESAPFFFTMDAAAGSEYLVLKGREGDELGVVVNPFEDRGVYHKDYHTTLLSVLPVYMDSAPAQMAEYRIDRSSFEGITDKPGHFYIAVEIPESLRTELLQSPHSLRHTAGKQLAGLS